MKATAKKTKLSKAPKVASAAPAKGKGFDATITPQKNEFDDNFLDVVGAEFKFDHAKGLAEWMKNSADAYATTVKASDAEQFIVMRFKEGQPKRESVFECIDFVGMTKSDIDKALKVWGLASAAKKGTTIATLGGHGNGGKFYMRQMFGKSRFITYRDGRLKVFGFDEKKRYGYAKGLEDAAMPLDQAVKFAKIETLDIPEAVKARWKKSPKAAGFTVVRGEHPERFSGRATVGTVLENLRLHPQARRLLAHKQVILVRTGQPWGERLEPPQISSREGFEHPRVIDLPKTFEFGGQTVEFRTKKYPAATLTLRTSSVPLSRASDLATMNGIDIMGEVGCLGSYRMNELGFLKNGPESEFIYGECKCPALEDPAASSVRNDREKLVENELTRGLLEWIKQQVDALAGEMSEKSRKERQSRDLRQSSMFNQWLDRWKNKFMVKLNAELFGGKGAGDSFGGFGGGGDDKSKTGDGKGRNGDKDTGEKDGGGGSGAETRKGPKFPRVLLSGYDLDPLDEHAARPFDVDERQPPVYQRAIDIDQGIYWINTARPLANKIMASSGSSSPRWREYLFQRYVDIILKQAVYELARRDTEMAAYKIDSLIDEVTSRVHDAAAQELEQFLFDDKLVGTTPEQSGGEPVQEAETSVAATAGG